MQRPPNRPAAGHPSGGTPPPHLQQLARAAELARAGNLEDAIAQARTLARSHPADEHVARFLGDCLIRAGHVEQGLFQYDRLARLRPGDAEIAGYTATLLMDLNRPREAVAHLRRAVKIAPDDHRNSCILADALAHMGRIDEAADALAIVVAESVPWARAVQNAWTMWMLCEAPLLLRVFAAVQERHGPSAVLQHASVPMLQYDASLAERATDRDSVFRAHVRAGELLSARFPPDAQPFTNTPDPERPLRIGYVSQDFRNRSVGHFIEPIFAGHDSSRFRVYAYHETLREDELTARLRQHVLSSAGAWRDIRRVDEQAVARMIRDDQIDILVDVSGHTGQGRIVPFALRSAPVQVSAIAYANTTGVRTIDYRLVDAHTDPAPDADAYATEKLVRIPACFLCYQPPPHAPDVAPAPCSLPGATGVSFGSFNAPVKVNDSVAHLWARLLASVPNSRLVLKGDGFMPDSRAGAGTLLRNALDAASVDPARLVIMHTVPSEREHLGAYAQIDIALDTFPYNGTTTTLEAAWMGVPTVTLAGDCHRARVGVSLLTNLALQDLIASSHDEYIARAAKLAAERTRLVTLRSTLRQKMLASPICDRAAYIARLESAYRDMWQRWCAQAH